MNRCSRRWKKPELTGNEETNSYNCPEGKELSYKGALKLNRNRGKKYQAKSSDCKGCPSREKCIASRGG
ncbi:MAG: transposase, partial [Treponema sp.]|nr:transposase [Treponema sp.]